MLSWPIRSISSRRFAPASAENWLTVTCRAVRGKTVHSVCGQMSELCQPRRSPFLPRGIPLCQPDGSSAIGGSMCPLVSGSRDGNCQMPPSAGCLPAVRSKAGGIPLRGVAARCVPGGSR